MASLSTKLTWDLAQTKWASTLNPVIAKPIIQGSLLNSITLKPGVNIINHGLGRKMLGWIVSDTDSSATIYRSAPLDDLTLTLTSSGSATVSLWVF